MVLACGGNAIVNDFSGDFLLLRLHSQQAALATR
jgi:hypothetical protein